eukprot:2752649-Prymnesium_polylepis.1
MAIGMHAAGPQGVGGGPLAGRQMPCARWRAGCWARRQPPTGLGRVRLGHFGTLAAGMHTGRGSGRTGKQRGRVRDVDALECEHGVREAGICWLRCVAVGHA